MLLYIIIVIINHNKIFVITLQYFSNITIAN